MRPGVLWMRFKPLDITDADWRLRWRDVPDQRKWAHQAVLDVRAELRFRVAEAGRWADDGGREI